MISPSSGTARSPTDHDRRHPAHDPEQRARLGGPVEAPGRQHSLLVEDAPDTRITRCRISDSAQNGIHIERSDGALVEKCRIQATGDNGITVVDSTGCVHNGFDVIMPGNTFSKNKAAKSGDFDLSDRSG